MRMRSSSAISTPPRHCSPPSKPSLDRRCGLSEGHRGASQIPVIHHEANMTVISCSSCGLRQWVPLSGRCRKCQARLNCSLIEIPLCVHEDASNNLRDPALRIGSTLRAMRLRQGRSQESVSSKARVPRSSLSRFESNACAPSLSTLARILAALGVESLYIRLGNGPPSR